MTVIAVFNQKGGVGKTTTALNLLAGIAQRKQRPLAIDLDPQAHLSGVFGVRPRLADDSVYSFFVRQRPLADVTEIAPSGVMVCPGHLDLSKLDTLLGKGVNVVTRLRTALRAPGIAPGPVVIDCCPLLGVLSLNAIFACDLVRRPGLRRLPGDAGGAAGRTRAERARAGVQGAPAATLSADAIRRPPQDELGGRRPDGDGVSARGDLRDPDRREREPGGKSRRGSSTCSATPRPAPVRATTRLWSRS